METLTFTNIRGEVVTFGGPPFYLQKVDGLGDVSASIQTQRAPYQNGSKYIDSVLDERIIPVEFVIAVDEEKGYKGVSESRTQIGRVLNPLLGLGTLKYSNGHIEREIKAVADSVPIYPDGPRTKLIQKGLVTFLCPSPFWEEVNPEVFKLEDFVGAFRFPFHFPVRFSTRGDGKTLVNKGDVPTPIQVEFRGPVTNPKITNTSTGEFIKVNQTIPEGFKLLIDTSEGNKKVDIIAPDGIPSNGFPYIDDASDFFSLDVGETRISFITDGGKPEVYVKYKNRYLSV
ncbi:phage tail family protein [Bacillus sp. JJ722]|uniref:phage tail family protein n=1 Tax=Bacillus sp. JJ722 TaxID=3122973 RepID=UPI002FFE9AC5